MKCPPEDVGGIGGYMGMLKVLRNPNNEEYESYMCDVNMDEDEYMRLISDQHYQCPYYRNGDDYRIVRHQM